MNAIHIALQEGFEDETVLIRLDGKEVFRKDNVRTKLQIGFADSFETGSDATVARVEISLPAKRLSRMIELQLPAMSHLGVSLIVGQIEYKTASEPFGYV